MAARVSTVRGGHRAMRCPECGGTLTLVRDGLVGTLYTPTFFVVGKDRLTYRMEPKPFVACTGCEFCLEVNYARA